MSDQHFLLLGAQTDPHLLRLAEAARDHGAVATVVNSRSRPSGPAVSFSPDGGWSIGGVALEEITAAFVRAVPPRHPSFAYAAEPFTRAQVQTAEAEGGALRDAVCASLERLWALGRPVLNPPAAGVYEQQKPWQLSIARRAGVRVPRTLVTNRVEQARAFVEALADDGHECIAKPVRGPGYASSVNVRDERLERIERAPVTLQERVEGKDVRVLLLDDSIVGAACITGTQTVDYREDPAFRAGDAHYEPFDVDDELARSLFSVQRGVGTSFSGVDLRVPADGPAVFLELNAAPAWLEMEERLGLSVTAALAARLQGET